MHPKMAPSHSRSGKRSEVIREWYSSPWLRDHRAASSYIALAEPRHSAEWRCLFGDMHEASRSVSRSVNTKSQWPASCSTTRANSQYDTRITQPFCRAERRASSSHNFDCEPHPSSTSGRGLLAQTQEGGASACLAHFACLLLGLWLL